MPNQPKTDARFIERLQRAAQHQMSAEEIRQQRTSFVYGNMPRHSTMTKRDVAHALARLDGDKA